MSEIRLTPSGQLRWQAVSGEPQPPEFAKLQKSFEQDWPQGLFKLAADKYKTTNSLTLGYWQGLAEHYLTGLCHIPESVDDIVVSPPSESVFSTLLLSAPPMSGGE